MPAERGQSFIHFLRGKSEKVEYDEAATHKSHDDPHKHYYEN